MVILTGTQGCRPTDYRKFKPLLHRCYAQTYPALYRAIVNRVSQYQQQINILRQA
ncbi:MAG: hypothetical protein LUC50_00100 [Ruminococcus sp.]|nr:hypothetical protein [Ruminococcus sp.]